MPVAAGPDLMTRLIEGASKLIELLAVVIIVYNLVYQIGLFAYRYATKQATERRYREMKEGLGASLLLGLEILVAADVVRTVVLEPTLENVAVLGLLVLVRTFLSWALVVEIDGRWPWRRAEAEAKGRREE